MTKYFCDSCLKPAMPGLCINLDVVHPSAAYSEEGQPNLSMITAVDFVFKDRNTGKEGRIDLCADCRVVMLQKLLKVAIARSDTYRIQPQPNPEVERVLQEARERSDQRRVGLEHESAPTK